MSIPQKETAVRVKNTKFAFACKIHQSAKIFVITPNHQATWTHDPIAYCINVCQRCRLKLNYLLWISYLYISMTLRMCVCSIGICSERVVTLYFMFTTATATHYLSNFLRFLTHPSIFFFLIFFCTHYTFHSIDLPCVQVLHKKE